MTKRGQLRYEYFIETGIVWIDTNDNIEMDYLKWVENKALTLTDVSQQRELLRDYNKFNNERIYGGELTDFEIDCFMDSRNSD